MLELLKTIVASVLALFISATPAQPAIGGIANGKDLFNDQAVKVYTICDPTEALNTDIDTSLRTFKAKKEDNTLRDLDQNEKSYLKSCEIVKRNNNIKGEYTNLKYGIKVEIVGDITQIESNGQSGIQLFARAWRGNKQLGFGPDGSIEIERFRIWNPPFLVPDDNGTVVREWIDEDTGELVQRKLRDDPTEAIREALVHTITVSSKEDTNIIIGSVGNTTDTFYPAAGTNAPMDGLVTNNGGVGTYATVNGATTGTGASATADSNSFVLNQWEPGDAQFYIRRSMFGFNIASIGTDTISSVTFSIAANGTAAVNANSDSVGIVSASPAATNNITTADFDAFGVTTYATKALADWVSTNNTYNDFSLSAGGISYVSGWSSLLGFLGTRTTKDISATTPTGGNNCYGYFADIGGTTSDPKLVVVHAGSAQPSVGTIIIFE